VDLLQSCWILCLAARRRSTTNYKCRTDGFVRDFTKLSRKIQRKAKASNNRRVEYHLNGFYHDGRFATLRDVVEHYDSFFKSALTGQEKNDLVEYLKSL